MVLVGVAERLSARRGFSAAAGLEAISTLLGRAAGEGGAAAR
jgi:hypothetical protein